MLIFLSNVFIEKEYDPNAKKDDPAVESDQENDKDFKPSRDYREKYMKIVGKESGVEAAKITVPNKNFGFGKVVENTMKP